MHSFHIFLGIAAYLCIGIGVVQIAMTHVRANAFRDNDFMRTTIDDARRSLMFRIPQIACIIAWPAAVLAAALVTIRRTQRSAHYSLQ